MKNGKRIAAIIGIIVILSLYIVTLLLGIFASDKYPNLFLLSTFLVVIIPIIIYCLVAVYRYVHKKDMPNTPIEDTDDIINK
ncbi:MAG: hypothetical protein GX321_07895 [Clostridiales bacterium]|nr:hypothetical protein [Clostridiales bacterium]